MQKRHHYLLVRLGGKGGGPGFGMGALLAVLGGSGGGFLASEETEVGRVGVMG